MRSSTTARVSKKVRNAVRQMGGQHGKHREGERDIGGDRHCPAAEVLGVAGGQIDRDVDACWDDHSPDCGGDGQRGTRGVAKVARDELALELQSDDEEEDRQQAVSSPRRHAQVQVQRFRSDRELRHRAIGLRPRRIRPCQRGARGHQQQHSADSLLSQDLRETLRFRPRAAREQSQTRWHWPDLNDWCETACGSMIPRWCAGKSGRQ